MKHAFIVLLPLVASLFLAGCGPTAGDDCEGGGYVCDDESRALECRQGRWRAIPCKGALGCSEVNGNIRCDVSGNAAGDACAASAEGRAQCSVDRKALLECRMGILVETMTCQSCAITSGSQVTCTP